jgi:hypothetical protein
MRSGQKYDGIVVSNGTHQSERIVPVSTSLFPIAATAFLVILALVIILFKAKHARGRVRGRGPFGLIAQPRHTFAQYDEEGEGEGSDAERGGQTGAEDRQKFR